MIGVIKEDATTAGGPNTFDIVIVGGGLSGMAVAHEMQRILVNRSWRLLEARAVLGGRLTNDHAGNYIDMGGAWFWPQAQPHMSRLVSLLSVRTFPQPDDPSSTRFVGGAVELIHRLADSLPQDHILLNTAVTACRLVRQTGQVCLETTSSETIYARRVVFAAPPKPLSKNVRFDPPLSNEKQLAMAESETWMAGVTKVALTYPSRFWQADDVSSMGLPLSLGPAFQVYDASTNDNRVSALTFFTLVPWDSTAAENDEVLADQCASQIQQVWLAMHLPELAKQVKSYTSRHIQRWPLEKYISEDMRPRRVNAHPSPIQALSTNDWDGALLFAGTETDTSSPGVMEGAVGAALRVVRDLKAYAMSPTKKGG